MQSITIPVVQHFPLIQLHLVVPKTIEMEYDYSSSGHFEKRAKTSTE